MQAPPRKKPVPRRGGRLLLLLCLLAAVCLGGGGLYLILREPAIPPAQPAASTARQLISREAAALAAVTVTLPEGETYTLTPENGQLIYQAETPFAVDETLAAEILTACTQLSALATLAETPAEYGGDLSVFGLDPPQCSVAVTYTDGSSLTYHIGDRLALETGYYFRLEGEDALYRVHDDLLNTFKVDAGVLYPVEQLRLQQTLTDRVTLCDGRGEVLHAFEKQGDGSFIMTMPARYPVHDEAMANILRTLGSFTLGAYLGPDTPENRAAQGLDEPQYQLVIHEAAGSAMTTTADGAAQSVPRAPRETTLILWPMEEDAASGRCAVNGGIYTFLKLSLAFVYDMDLTEDLLLRQPANLSLGELASLTVENAGGRTVYTLTHTPRLTEDGQPETDSDGNPTYDTAVTANGENMNAAAFAARLESLNSVSVSGRLPEGFTPAEAVTDTLTFTMLSGLTRTVTLAPYDALHNAVGIDGVYLFYLIRGGLTF